MIDFDLIEKEREWEKSDIGQLFVRYENYTAEAWVYDCKEYPSDQKLKQLWERQRVARKALLFAIRGW